MPPHRHRPGLRRSRAYSSCRYPIFTPEDGPQDLMQTIDLRGRGSVDSISVLSDIPEEDEGEVDSVEVGAVENVENEAILAGAGQQHEDAGNHWALVAWVWDCFAAFLYKRAPVSVVTSTM